MADGSKVTAAVKSSLVNKSDDRVYDVEYITRKIGNRRLTMIMIMMVVEIIPLVFMSHLVARR